MVPPVASKIPEPNVIEPPTATTDAMIVENPIMNLTITLYPIHELP